MKKFTQVVGVIREAEEKALSELQKSYREYFLAKLNKFGVKSPAELDDEKKKEFFNEITNDWDKGKGATTAGQADVEKHGVSESYQALVEERAMLSALLIEGESLPQLRKMLRQMEGSRDMFANAHQQTQNDKDNVKFYEDRIAEIKAKIEAKTGIKESVDLNEKDVTNAAEFKEYATEVLKKAHGDKFDQKTADETIKGLSDEAEKDENWGKAIGKLQSGLSEAAVNEGANIGDVKTFVGLLIKGAEKAGVNCKFSNSSETGFTVNYGDDLQYTVSVARFDLSALK